MKAASSFVVLVVAGGLVGCGGGNASPVAHPPMVPKPAAAPSPSPQSAPSAAVAETPAAAPKYEAKGRRDPFENLEVREGASGPTVAAARLTGIVFGSRGPLALVETSDGLGYILKPGDTLGDGRLLEIGPDSVVFRIATRSGANTDRVVLRLPGD